MAAVHMLKTHQNIIKTLFGILALSCNSLSLASGFALQEQNTAYLGTAYSGTAAWALDASSAWYNPAALTHIKNKQFVVSGILINSDAKFRASSSNIPFQPGVTVPGSQEDNDNPGGLSTIPALHYAARIHPNLVFGLSVAAPYGLSTDYNPQRVMRYVATHSEVLTLDFSPSLAYKPTSWLSIGGGLDALYSEAIFEVQTTAFTSGDVTKDGFQNNRASDWALGWHLGALVECSDCTRLGLNYRSKYDLRMKGDSQQLAPITPISPLQSGEFIVRPVYGNVVLPEVLVFSAYHSFSSRWAVMIDASWTAWSRLEDLILHFDSLPNDSPPLVNAVDSDTVLDFKDTFKIGMGFNYAYNRCWQFRIGTAFDQSPVRNEFTRTARLPDADRIWLACGASYAWNQMRVDLGYAHLFIKDSTISDNGPLNAQTGLPLLPFNNVSGKYSNHADILGIQLRYDFV